MTNNKNEELVYGLLYGSENTNDFVSNNELVEDDSFQSERCHMQQVWSLTVAEALEEVASFDPRPVGTEVPEKEEWLYNRKNGLWEQRHTQKFKPVLSSPPPSSLSALEASVWSVGESGVDMRPHLRDQETNSLMLLDSGAQCSTFPPEPGDKVDPSMTLRAVNGSKLNCYGYKDVEVRIHRKKFKIKVIKSDVESPILGWDFIRKHKFTTYFNDWGDVCLRDPVSKISTVLEYKPIPFLNYRGVAKLRIEEEKKSVQSSPLQTSFEVASMEALTPESEMKR